MEDNGAEYLNKCNSCKFTKKGDVMKDRQKYRGIIPAFYACYDAEGNVDTERVKALTEYMIKKGVKGIYVNGSSGECIYLSKEERKTILEAVMEAAKGKLTVICHVACNNTADSMELAAHAEKCGVDAIASIPPIYFHLPEYAIAKYWNDISSAAPNTEFVIYNIPQLAGTALTPGLLSEMLKNPNVVAVKNSSMPVQDIEMFLSAGQKAKGEDGFIVFNGPDEQFISGRAMGAWGGIGGTYASMPELFLKADELVLAGNMEEARKLQFDINEIIYALCSCRGNMYAVIKEVLRRREGLDIGGVRSPLVDIVPEDNAKIEACCTLIDDAIRKWC